MRTRVRLKKMCLRIEFSIWQGPRSRAKKRGEKGGRGDEVEVVMAVVAVVVVVVVVVVAGRKGEASMEASEKEKHSAVYCCVFVFVQFSDLFCY